MQKRIIRKLDTLSLTRFIDENSKSQHQLLLFVAVLCFREDLLYYRKAQGSHIKWQERYCNLDLFETPFHVCYVLCQGQPKYL